MHFSCLVSSESGSKKVEPVLNIDLGSSLYFLNDLRPLIPDLKVLLQYQHIFFQRKWLAFDVWIQEVDPPLSALLSVPFTICRIWLCCNCLVEVLRNYVPVLIAIMFDDADEDDIFFSVPRQLLDGLTLFLSKSIATLEIISPWQVGRDCYPVFFCQQLFACLFA